MIERISQPKKGTFRDLVSTFKIFFVLARWRFLTLPVLFFVVGLFESVGIVLFFPLLEQLQPGQELVGHEVAAAIARLLSWLHLRSFHGILLLLALVFLSKFFVVYGQSFAVASVARDLHRSLADRLLTGIARAEYAKLYLGTSTGFIANALTRELQIFIAAFTHYAGTLASIILVAVYLITSFLLDARMTIVATVVGVILVVLMRSLTWMSRREGMASTQMAGEYQNGIIEFMQQYKYLKATNRFSVVGIRLRDVVMRMTRSRFRLNIIAGFIAAIPEPIAVILVAILMYVYVVRWHQSFALIAVILLLFYRTVMRLMALQSDWNSFFAASGALRVIPETLVSIDREREVQGADQVRSLRDGIALTDVRFCYGERVAVDGACIRIPARATVAFVGTSGGGKSTLVDLITGVLKPSDGRLTYDGVEHARADLDAFRARIGYVTQEITMFRDTILANVAFGEDVSREDVRMRVRDACDQAQCREFIEALPNQYETNVGDRGINLSVGQRQRIAIARELYRDPAMLIFDEATSALDSESERALQRSIEALKGMKTLIVIAHRLSTIKYADYIYVIDAGRVAEEGTFDALYGNASSVFRRMCDLQSFV